MMNDQSQQIPPGKFVGIGMAGTTAQEPTPPPPQSSGFPVWGLVTIGAVVIVAIVVIAMNLNKKKAVA